MASRADELWLLLLQRHTHPRPVKWGGWTWGQREVYLGQDGRWHVTYGRDLPPHRPFTREDVYELLRRGLIVSTYPGEPSANQCYSSRQDIVAPGKSS